MAALSQEDLKRLSHRAAEYHLDVLCEVHDAEELQRATDAVHPHWSKQSQLANLQIDLDTALRLESAIPKNAFRVAESGIHGADIGRLVAAGYQAFLDR